MPRSAPLTGCGNVRPASEGRPARHVAYRIAAAALARFAAIPMMGLIDRGTLVGTSDPRYEWPVSLDVSWGALFTSQLAASSRWLAVQPRDAAPALVQQAVAALALCVGAAAGSSAEALRVQLSVAVAIALFAPLPRGASVPRPTWRRPDRRSVLLATAGVGLWVPYALAARSVPQRTRAVRHERRRRLARAGSDRHRARRASVALAFWPAARPLVRGSVALSAALIGVAGAARPGRGGPPSRSSERRAPGSLNGETPGVAPSRSGEQAVQVDT
ncbi:MAG: hypothetical protein JWP66_1866 [Naasia sp.]|nr:hypothetical protein [Naasia sp.]